MTDLFQKVLIEYFENISHEEMSNRKTLENNVKCNSPKVPYYELSWSISESTKK